MFLSDNLDLKTIYEELSCIIHRWFKLGVLMGISYHKLKEFKREEEPLAAVIDYGLKGNIQKYPFTWKSIVKVLIKLKESGLASRLEKKYCQDVLSRIDDTGNAA